MEPLLQVRNLKTHFFTEDGVVPAVDDVSFDIRAGEAMALVGESGCGKSVTALSILRLISYPGKIAGGEILYRGKNLLKNTDEEMRRIRGNEIAMIFQEPMTSLNPVFTVGDQIMEAVRLHQKKSKKDARDEAIRSLKLVGIPDPEKRVDNYPHEMSGGMRQRVMIAMALSCNPSLLIADEPTTALDVTIQAQIMELLAGLQEKLGLAVLLITHDLGVVAEFAKRVVVMYTGKVVEEAPVGKLFKDPKHPYTQGLLRSVPKIHKEIEAHKKPRLATIEGMVPDLTTLPNACHFAPRCEFVKDACRAGVPELRDTSPDQHVRCVLY
jgi:oligopeptide/dipeptide ABC transporter ATP-binding protein